MECVRSVFGLNRAQEFTRQVNEDNEDHFFETASKHRKRTDLTFLLFFGISFCILALLLVYCFIYGDINRVIVGYDRCGNVCGKINSFRYDFPTNCKAEDMLNKPYFSVHSKTCVAKCDENTIAAGYKCVNTKSSNENPLMEQILLNVHACLPEFIALCFFALGLSYIMLLLLRYLTAVFVWTCLIGTCTELIMLASLFWYWKKYDEKYVKLAIMYTVLSIVMVFLTACLKDEIKLVAELFKQAGKAVSGVPFILFEPLLTFIALAIAITSGIYTTLWIQSAGVFLLNSENNQIELYQDFLILFSYCFNIFVFLWTIEIIYGCENMLLAGAVSMWYFSRNKTGLKGLMWKSAKNMIKYHLGTISFAALLITIVQMLSIICRCCQKIVRHSCDCICEQIQHFLVSIEKILRYVKRNGFVITAIYGYQFTKSSAIACSLLLENASTTFALSVDGAYVLGMAKLVVVTTCGLTGYFLIQRKENVQTIFLPVALIVFFAFLIIQSFITVYEMVIDTIFICFCEDTKMNDGESRPYYMPHSLMEFVKKAKECKTIKPKNKNDTRTVTVNNPSVV